MGGEEPGRNPESVGVLGRSDSVGVGGCSRSDVVVGLVEGWCVGGGVGEEGSITVGTVPPESVREAVGPSLDALPLLPLVVLLLTDISASVGISSVSCDLSRDNCLSRGLTGVVCWSVGKLVFSGSEVMESKTSSMYEGN